MNPFSQAWGLIAAGFEPLPIPLGAKSPPPQLTTGSRGVMLSDEQIEDVTLSEGNMNMGIRLPKGVIGIDIDNSEALRTLQNQLGTLTPTWGVSAGEGHLTLFYRVLNDGGNWLSHLPNNSGDIIHHGYRYSISGGSLHPSGRVYKWVYGSPNKITHATPILPAEFSADTLAIIPEKWEDTLSISLDARGNITPIDIMNCRHVSTAIKIGVSKIRNSRDIHISMRSATWTLAALCTKGHQVDAAALSVIDNAYEAACRRDHRTYSSGETLRAYEGALRKQPISSNNKCAN